MIRKERRGGEGSRLTSGFLGDPLNGKRESWMHVLKIPMAYKYGTACKVRLPLPAPCRLEVWSVYDVTLRVTSVLDVGCRHDNCHHIAQSSLSLDSEYHY